MKQNSKSKVGLHVRQGDVLLLYVDKIPDTAIEDAKDPLGRAVLAYGEVSGHAHMIEETELAPVQYKRTPEGERFLSLLGQTLIKHGTITNDGIADGTADHSALVLHDGHLIQGFQVEDFGEEIRRVAD